MTLGWEEEAANWIAIARDPDDSYWFYRDAFFELLPEPGERTLEIGCGEGRVMHDLAERGHRAVGVEVSPTLLDAAREADPRGEYVLSDAASLPFANESFDLAVAYNSLMDIDEMATAVREAWRSSGRAAGSASASRTRSTTRAGSRTRGPARRSTWTATADAAATTRRSPGTA